MKFFEYKDKFYNLGLVHLVVFVGKIGLFQKDLVGVEFLDDEDNVTDEFELTKDEAERLRSLLY